MVVIDDNTMSAIQIPIHEILFRTSRSGGPGGQNVNKLETRVELLFDIKNSLALTEEQKRVIIEKLASRIDENGVLRVVAQESRSQWQNKQVAIKKFIELLRRALRPVKKRVATKPTLAAKEERLKVKKVRSAKKRLRKFTIQKDEFNN